MAADRLPARFPRGPLLRDVGELDDPGLRADHARSLAEARVVFANHAVLQHDFPSLSDDALLLAGVRNCLPAERQAAFERAREAWLLDHAALMSVTQVGQAQANTPIQAHGDVREVWRPSRYGRALVIAVHSGQDSGSSASAAMMDLKGAGVAPGAVPSPGFHASGLCSLGEVLREVLFQSLIDRILRDVAPWFWTVPWYGVIDPGFDVIGRDGDRLPAGLLVRRAHRRPPGGLDLPLRFSVEEQTQVQIELLLRHYGLTSSNRGTRFRFERQPDGPRVLYADAEIADASDADTQLVAGWLAGLSVEACDGINVQMARGVSAAGDERAQLVDFGHYEMRERFTEPLVSLVCNQRLRWGAAIRPDDPSFVQPSPSLVVSARKWGFVDLPAGTTRPRRSEGEGAAIFAHDLARRFRASQLTGAEVRDRMAQFLADGAGT